jgi:hypothetical protein
VQVLTQLASQPLIAKGGIQELSLFAVPESQWKPHDRHIRADDAGIELSAGFDRLRSERTRQAFTATYLCLEDVQKLKDEENAVRAALGGPPTPIL